MAALKGIIFALGIVLTSAQDLLAPPSPCNLDNARYLPIYDLENTTYNVLGYEELLSSFARDGFYQFKDVQSKMFGGMFYGDYPVLVVYQPDENVPELHGYHYPFPWVIIKILDHLDSTGSCDGVCGRIVIIRPQYFFTQCLVVGSTLFFPIESLIYPCAARGTRKTRLRGIQSPSLGCYITGWFDYASSNRVYVEDISSRGLRLIYDSVRYGNVIHSEYKNFRDYLNSPIEKEGYTPSAALQIYPEFENMKLTKITRDPNEENITHGFALLFLLPKKDEIKPNNFDKKYTLFEQFYYNGTKICKDTDEINEVSQRINLQNLQGPADDFLDEEDDEYVPLLTIYDRDPESKGHNVLNLDFINEYFGQNEFYRFEDFVREWLPYDEYPILIVIQPDEKLAELHGYYFDEGILSLVSYVNENPEFLSEYQPLFEYLEREPDLDGLTPDAARFDYPHFLDFKMTKFVHAENVADQFAALFLAPARHRPANFLQKYDVLEDYGIGHKYIVEYEL